MKKRIYLVLLMFVITSFCYSQTKVINGKLKIKNTPISTQLDAVLASQSDGLVTDSGFKISDLQKKYNFISELISDTSIEVGYSVFVYKYENNIHASINSLYDIKTSSQASLDGDIIDELGLGFTLNNGLIAVLSKTEEMTNAHFGVYPDGVTNWEGESGSTSAKLHAMFKASTYRHLTIKKGHYKTGFNSNNSYSGMRIHWDNVEWGGILHLISSSVILQETEITSMIDNGSTIDINFSAAHGMNSDRFVEFTNTNTDLDDGKHFATVIDTDTFRITSTADISVYTSLGYAEDAPLDDVKFTGTHINYERFGTINLTNFYFDTIVQGSDASKNTNGNLGRGVHIYFGCKNWYGNQIIAIDTDIQSGGTNIHGAIAIDGTDVENININTLHVKESGVSGVILQAKNFNIGSIIVDSYGRGLITQAPVNPSPNDVHGRNPNTMACGVWFGRSSGTVGSIRVKNKKPDGNLINYDDRTSIYADVQIGRTHVEWNVGNTTFFDSKASVNIQNITLDNVLNIGVAGSNEFINTNIGAIDVLYVPINNPQIVNTSSERDNYGLIFHTKGRMKIGSATFTNIDYATAIKSYYSTALTSYFELRNFYVNRHKSTIIHLGNNFRVENVYSDGRESGDDKYSIVCENNSIRSPQSVLSNVKMLNLGLVACKAIDFQTDNSILSGVYLYRYGSDSGAAVRFSGDTSRFIGGYLLGNSNSSVASTASGFEYNGCDRSNVEDVRVTSFLGTGVIGSGTNLRAAGCVSVSNGTATSVLTANFVTNSQTGAGNFTWMN